MIELKNSIESFNITLIQTDERCSELEDRSFAIIQSEKQKEYRMKKWKKPVWIMGFIKWNNLCITGITEAPAGEEWEKA